MAILKPNYTYTANGVKVCEKIIPDGTRWKNDTKAFNAGFGSKALYKKEAKLSDNTGKPQFITIHNTDDISGVTDDGEQYTRATYNENMGSARVHFYVDDTCAWQNLKAGTNMTPNDPAGSAEVGWHAGDGSVHDGGNMTSLSIEIIMDRDGKNNNAARENGAHLAAWLLWKYGLNISRLVTHTYWVNKAAGKTFQDIDTQCTTPIMGKKWCPAYIFGSTNTGVALKNWRAFKELVEKHLKEIYSKEKISDNTENIPFSPYLVRVRENFINVRLSPGDGFACCGKAAKGVYTIIAESYDDNGKMWGKLKSGAGWVALEQTEKFQ